MSPVGIASNSRQMHKWESESYIPAAQYRQVRNVQVFPSLTALLLQSLPHFEAHNHSVDKTTQ
jgi:hypothetical protein